MDPFPPSSSLTFSASNQQDTLREGSARPPLVLPPPQLPVTQPAHPPPPTYERRRINPPPRASDATIPSEIAPRAFWVPPPINTAPAVVAQGYAAGDEFFASSSSRDPHRAQSREAVEVASAPPAKPAVRFEELELHALRVEVTPVEFAVKYSRRNDDVQANPITTAATNVVAAGEAAVVMDDDDVLASASPSAPRRLSEAIDFDQVKWRSANAKTSALSLRFVESKTEDDFVVNAFAQRGNVIMFVVVVQFIRACCGLLTDDRVGVVPSLVISAIPIPMLFLGTKALRQCFCSDAVDHWWSSKGPTSSRVLELALVLSLVSSAVLLVMQAVANENFFPTAAFFGYFTATSNSTAVTAAPSHDGHLNSTRSSDDSSIVHVDRTWEGIEVRWLLLFYVVRPRFFVVLPFLFATWLFFGLAKFVTQLHDEHAELINASTGAAYGLMFTFNLLCIARIAYWAEQKEREAFVDLAAAAEERALIRRVGKTAKALAARMAVHSQPLPSRSAFLIERIGKGAIPCEVAPPELGVGTVMFACFHGLVNRVLPHRDANLDMLGNDLLFLDEFLQRVDRCRGLLGGDLVRAGALGDGLWFVSGLGMNPDAHANDHAPVMCRFAVECKAAFEQTKLRRRHAIDRTWDHVEMQLAIDSGITGAGYMGHGRMGYALSGPAPIRARSLSAGQLICANEGPTIVALVTETLRDLMLAQPVTDWRYNIAADPRVPCHAVSELNSVVNVLVLTLPESLPATVGAHPPPPPESHQTTLSRSTRVDLTPATNPLMAPPQPSDAAGDRGELSDDDNTAKLVPDDAEMRELREASSHESILLDLYFEDEGLRDAFEEVAAKRRFELCRHACWVLLLEAMVVFAVSLLLDHDALAEQDLFCYVQLVVILIAFLAVIVVSVVSAMYKQAASLSPCKAALASVLLQCCAVATVLVQPFEGPSRLVSVASMNIFVAFTSVIASAMVLPFMQPIPFFLTLPAMSLFISASVSFPDDRPLYASQSFFSWVVVMLVYLRMWSDLRRTWATHRFAIAKQKQIVAVAECQSAVVEELAPRAAVALVAEGQRLTPIVASPHSFDSTDRGSLSAAGSSTLRLSIDLARPLLISPRALIAYVKVTLPSELSIRIGKLSEIKTGCNKSNTICRRSTCECLALSSALWNYYARIRACFNKLREANMFCTTSDGDDLIAVADTFHPTDARMEALQMTLESIEKCCRTVDGVPVAPVSRLRSRTRFSSNLGYDRHPPRRDADGENSGGGSASTEAELFQRQAPSSTIAPNQNVEVRGSVICGSVAGALVGGKFLSYHWLGSGIARARMLAYAQPLAGHAVIGPEVAVAYRLRRLPPASLPNMPESARYLDFDLHAHGRPTPPSGAPVSEPRRSRPVSVPTASPPIPVAQSPQPTTLDGDRFDSLA